MAKTTKRPNGRGSLANRMKLADPKRIARFLEVLARRGNITEACAAVDLKRDSIYRMRRDNPEFRAAMEEAIEAGLDEIEEALRSRAIEGVERYVVSAGKVVCDKDGSPLKIREYSDSGAQFLLRVKRYREDKLAVEHSGPGGAPLPSERTVIILPSNGRDDEK